MEKNIGEYLSRKSTEVIAIVACIGLIITIILAAGSIRTEQEKAHGLAFKLSANEIGRCLFSKKSVLISLYIIYIRFLCIVVGIGFFLCV